MWQFAAQTELYNELIFSFFGFIAIENVYFIIVTKILFLLCIISRNYFSLIKRANFIKLVNCDLVDPIWIRNDYYLHICCTKVNLIIF